MYSRRYCSRNRELDLDMERAALRVAILSNNSVPSLFPTYPYYSPYPSYNYLSNNLYYGLLTNTLPYFTGYPYVPPYPYLLN